MKILTAQQIRDCDAHTIAIEPIPSIDLMERASSRFVKAFEQVVSSQSKSVSIFCGTGNNGGDGLVIARLLHHKGWAVDCYLVQFSEKMSPDNVANQERLKDSGVSPKIITSISDFPSEVHPLIIDALVGTGITRPLEGLLGEVVQEINKFSGSVFAVDLPSGLFDRDDCSEYLDRIVHAHSTFTFQNPKRNFLLPEYANVVGAWQVLDIGLDHGFIDQLSCDEFLLQASDIQSLIQPRLAHSHKGTFGHAGLICGSQGMVGAAVLSTNACLRSGAGLTTIMVPEVGYDILQTSCPEAMCLTSGQNYIDAVPNLEKYNAIGIGPGLGQNKATKDVLLDVIRNSHVPLVIDADGLNLLDETDLSNLPVNSIITPHPKEFERLFGKTENSHARISLLQKKAASLKIIILLKGHHSAIAFPNGQLYFNSTGNPGMAKGGSGDVLTGLITGLVARGLTSENAAVIGCYLHGLAGDICADAIGMEGMTALDLVHHLPEAWQILENL